MRPKLLTDAELRAHFFRTHSKTYPLPADTILTPAARDFVKEQGINLVPAGNSMSMSPIPKKGGKPVYVEAATGRELTEKPETMTHLRGNLLVPKTHPRIAFRGKLDSLQAQIIALQVRCKDEPALLRDLGELLSACRAILGAEVKEEPLPPLRILGMDSGELRRCSHQVKEVYGIGHPVPSYEMGPICAQLNLLRTQVRETELSAARAFEKGDSTFDRADLIEGLNRLSSAVYILFCRKVSGWYEQQGGGNA